jgi:hypothetical protein
MRTSFGFVLLLLSACSSTSKNGASVGDGSQGGSGAGRASTGGSGGNGASPSGAAGSGGPHGGANGIGGANGTSIITLPQVYPPVRAATPTALIADPNYAALPFRSGLHPVYGSARQAIASSINLAVAIQERFYSTGPTDLLRIVSGVDGRVQGLDLTVAAHACLTTSPIPHTYELPNGQSFEVKLQCMQRFGSPGMNAGWVGFGIERLPSAEPEGMAAGSTADASAPTDAGSGATDAGDAADGFDFYLIEGQEGGNGGAYHIDPSGNVEGWLAVAERDIPGNSQVIMHLWTEKAARTLELSLAGSGVGFCAAHLKTNPDFLFVSGKTNAPPPPGTTQTVGTQYCDAPRAGCYGADDLGTDLGSDSPSCAAIGPSSFDVGVELDSESSGDAGANVVTTEIYRYFSQMPVGIPDF